MPELGVNFVVISASAQKSQSTEQHLPVCDSDGSLIVSSNEGDATERYPTSQLENNPSTPERSSEPSLEERIHPIVENNEVDPHEVFDSEFILVSQNKSHHESSTNSSIAVTFTSSPIDRPSTPERSSEPSLEEESLVYTSSESSAETMINTEVAAIDEHNELESLEDITVYEVITEYTNVPLPAHTSHPHIYLQLWDGQIINAENGQAVINLSQFELNNEPAEPREDHDTPMPSGQGPLHIDSQFMKSTQEDAHQPQQQLTESIASPLYEQLSQPLLAHEETVVADSIIEEGVEEEMVREVRSWISTQPLYPPPEGWLDNEQNMFYNTIESKWGSEGIPEEIMLDIKRHHVSKAPTNADCIKYLFGHEEVDDPRVPDHIHYRRCKRPTTLEEVYRRWSFRLRRRAYFARPAINIGGMWFPEEYLPDPEDPEWSWKEGIEVDRPAQSLYQLNEGKVFWDPFKHQRVRGIHPYYKWPVHERCVDRKVPPNPIRHVKRPTEQFHKFDIERYPHSHFTTREIPDSVQYHPQCQGPRPLGDGSTQGLTDITMNQMMFWPPQNQEWFVPCNLDSPQMELGERDHAIRSPTRSGVVEEAFDLAAMLPYVPPTSLFADGEEAIRRQMGDRWGNYNDGSQRESLKQWQENDVSMSQENIPIVATTSSASIIMQQEASGSTPYKIPELPRFSLLSNRVNNLAANISPPARAKLPKPPGSEQPQPRSLFKMSGLRPTQQRKKKK